MKAAIADVQRAPLAPAVREFLDAFAEIAASRVLAEEQRRQPQYTLPSEDARGEHHARQRTPAGEDASRVR